MRRHLAELAERNVEDGAVIVIGQCQRRSAGYVGSSGGPPRGGRRRAGAAPGRLDVEAIPVCAGARTRTG